MRRDYHNHIVSSSFISTNDQAYRSSNLQDVAATGPVIVADAMSRAAPSRPSPGQAIAYAPPLTQKPQAGMMEKEKMVVIKYGAIVPGAVARSSRAKL